MVTIREIIGDEDFCLADGDRVLLGDDSYIEVVNCIMWLFLKEGEILIDHEEAVRIIRAYNKYQELIKSIYDRITLY